MNKFRKLNINVPKYKKNEGNNGKNDLPDPELELQKELNEEN